jgi:hypothetical protein
MTRKTTKASNELGSGSRVQGKPAPRKRGADKGRAAGVFADLPPPSPLRGILPSTPEIEALVEQILEGRPASPTARQRIVDDFKMQYYFGGYPLLYRQTDQGKEVLAVGSEEIRQLRRKKMPQAERETIILGHPDPW